MSLSRKPLDIRKWPLTAGQLIVLRFISDHVRTRGYPPSHRELCAHLGLAKSCTQAAFDYVIRLQRKGMVSIVPKIARGMRITAAGQAEMARIELEEYDRDNVNQKVDL